jgi:hypothetical protein
MIRLPRHSSRLSTFAAALFATASLAAPSAQTPPKSAPSQSTELTKLSGCVDVDKKNRRAFTLDDEGEIYALKGVNLRDYIGKQVEITGSPSKGLKIVGGLYPSPNVAAQAGGHDHTQEAMAAQAGPNANQPRPPTEFNVKSVRAIGACPAEK